MAYSAVAIVSALFLFAVNGIISVLTTAVNECSYTGNMGIVTKIKLASKSI